MNIHLRAGVLALALSWLLPVSVSAQIDPLLAGSADEQPPLSSWHFYGDFMARAESTSGFVNRDDIERLRGRLRSGLRWDGDALTFAMAAKLGVGTDSNSDNRRNLDNERSNDLGLDEMRVSWQASDATRLSLGKSGLPLRTTPLTWDSDLRPIGGWLDSSRASGDFDRWSLVAGHFAGDHLYHDRSRISVVQGGWHYHEGAPFSAEVLLAWWDYDDLERATREGLSRTNRQAGGRLLSDYRILNLQFGARWQLEQQPLALRLDLVQNTGADDLNKGARFSAVYGDANQANNWEYAVAYQRIGRDAVPAAFNADDWWFHSAARGVMPWVGYGINETWSMQLSGFYERLDRRDEHITRILLDLRARW